MMKQHSIMLLLVVIILAIIVYLILKKEDKVNENFRRLDCSACDSGDWNNCSAQLEASCT